VFEEHVFGRNTCSKRITQATVFALRFCEGCYKAEYQWRILANGGFIADFILQELRMLSAEAGWSSFFRSSSFSFINTIDYRRLSW